MKIGIDISQTAYENTGVGNYVKTLTEHLIKVDEKNEYILFFSSLRRKLPSFAKTLTSDNPRVKTKVYHMPPTMMDVFWNRLHIMPIEDLIGDIDVFFSSDWVQPPTRRAKKVTILYDLIIYKYPEETHNQFEFNFKSLIISPNIVDSQRRRLKWVKKECDAIMCISESTKEDAIKILGIDENRLMVSYPGI